MSMKRIFSLAMAATMLFSATAYGATVEQAAEELNVPILTDKDTGKYSLPTYTTVTAGNEYMIWAVKGVHTQASQVSFGQSDVLYINQNTATSSGVTFDAFLPMETEDSTVLVTGQGMTEPKIVGYIMGEKDVEVEAVGKSTNVPAYTVAGQNMAVTYNLPCKVGYLDEGGKYVTLKTDGVNEDGSYGYTAPAGVDKLIVVVKGDVNGDGKITNPDRVRLNAALLNKVTLSDVYQFTADVTEDGKMTNPDRVRLNAVLLNKTSFKW